MNRIKRYFKRKKIQKELSIVVAKVERHRRIIKEDGVLIGIFGVVAHQCELRMIDLQKQLKELEK